MIKNAARLPYMVDFRVVEKMLGAVAQRGSLGISELYAQIPQVDDSSKSQAKNMLEYLGLIRTEGRIVYLTELGARHVRSDETTRQNTLIQNLPSEYVDLLKLASQHPDSIDAESLAKEYLSLKGLNSKAFLGKFIVRSWANYMERLGLARYAKGRNGGVQLTSAGISFLSNNRPSAPAENAPRFVVQIVTPERNFTYDVRADEDWYVVDAALNVAKHTWKKYYTQ